MSGESLKTEKRSTKTFFRAGAGVVLIAVQQRSLGCARDDRGDWCLLVSSHSAPLIPGHASLLSNFRVQGCSGGFAANMMGLRSKRIVIESEVEKSSLQTDE